MVCQDKLKGRRLHNGWTLEQMAGRLKEAGYPISKAALGQFEKGTTSPKADTLRAISRVFQVKPTALLESEFKLNFIGFRSLVSLPQKGKERIMFQMSAKAESREMLSIKSGHQRKEWSLERYKISVIEQADEIALQVRMEWDLGLDAINSLVDVIERNGAEVIEIQEDRRFSGLSATSSTGVPYIAIQYRERDGARQRMDLAHELAHLVLDTSSPVDEEEFAHRFAGAFLLPREVVTSELGTKRRDLNLHELRALKGKYGASIQAWVRRAKDCGVISASVYKSLNIKLNVAGLRSDEGEPYVRTEAINRDMRLAARCVTEHILSIEDAARLAGIPRSEIDEQSIIPAQNPRASALRNMTREQRRALAAEGRAALAESYAAAPDDVLPDLMDLLEE